MKKERWTQLDNTLMSKVRDKLAQMLSPTNPASSMSRTRKLRKGEDAKDPAIAEAANTWKNVMREFNERKAELKKRDDPQLQYAKFVKDYETAAKKKYGKTEIATLTPAERQNVLTEIQAPSEWAAYYDLQAFPPRENYFENEDFFENIPYFKDTIDLRAEMSVGVGFQIKDDESDEDTPQELFLRNEYKRLKLNSQLLIKTHFNRDLYGNGYWDLDWIEMADGRKISLNRVRIIHPPRMRIRLEKKKGNRILGYAYIPPQLVIGEIPLPEARTPDRILHFAGDDYDDTPYGYSKAFGMKRVLQGRWDINILLPILFKHYAKPWIHFTVKSEGLSPALIASKVTSLRTLLEDQGPDSDLVTSDIVDSKIFSGSQAMKHPQELIDDLDSQLFGNMKVPETFYKSRGSTDRKILKQDDNFVKEMKAIQEYFRDKLEELNLLLLEAKFGPRWSDPFEKDGKQVRVENYTVPDVVWNEIFEEDKNQQWERTGRAYDRGLLTINEARKMTELEPLEENEFDELKSEKLGLMTGQAPPEEINPTPPTLDQTGNYLGQNQETMTKKTKRKESLEVGSTRITLEEK